MTTKVCSRCKVEKDLSEFNKHSKYKDGHEYWCRKCVSLYRREKYLEKHPKSGYAGDGVKKYWENLSEGDKEKRIKKLHEGTKKYWEEKAPLPNSYQRKFDPWHKEKLKWTIPSVCRALRVHAIQLKDDPERLTTDFIKDLAGIKKRECPGVSE
jgi:hypothetical protein